MLEYIGWERLGRETSIYVVGGSPHPCWVQTVHCSCFGTARLLSVALMHTLQGSLTDSMAHNSQEKISTPPAEDRRAAHGTHLRRPLLEISGSSRALSPGWFVTHQQLTGTSLGLFALETHGSASVIMVPPRHSSFVPHKQRMRLAT